MPDLAVHLATEGAPRAENKPLRMVNSHFHYSGNTTQEFMISSIIVSQMGVSASRKIQQVAIALRLSEVVALAATRLYTLAVEHKFTKGRKSMNVVAVCLYVACRQKETRNYMLIDFSDLLQVHSRHNSSCNNIID